MCEVLLADHVVKTRKIDTLVVSNDQVFLLYTFSAERGFCQ